jgi:hypothetical protein
MNITTATPVEIDTAIAAIYAEAAPLATRVDMAQKDVDHYTARLGQRGYAYITQADVDRAEVRLANAEDALALVLAQTAPYDEEFTARGGWTRAWLVLNSNGHVHSSRACSSCNYRTSFGWLPQVSGQDEAEIVAAAGEGACTICYPSAPVDTLSRPRTLLHATEVEAAAARAAKAAKKAEADAKKAAKALEIDLRPLGVDSFVGRIHTLAAAKAYLTSAAEYVGWGRTHPYYPAAAVQFAAEAVAAKVGTTVEEEMAAAAKRAAKRR